MSESNAEVDVLLLAAGFGKRLKPLTDTTPKPLISIGNETLLDRHIRQLTAAGFKRVFINMHHLAPQISAHIKQLQSQIEIIPVFEPVLLDTGGAIKNIADKIQSDHLLTVNSDILVAEFPYQDFVRTHCQDKENPLATLVLRRDPNASKYGELAINATGRITSFLAKDYYAGASEKGFMYTGIQLISRQLFSRIPIQDAIFSITKDVYPQILSLGGILKSFVFSDTWFDSGTPEQLEGVKKWVLSEEK